MSDRPIDAALDRALEAHYRYAEATIERTCEDCRGSGVINYRERIWSPEFGRYVLEERPSMCFFCEGSGTVKVTPDAAELLDRVCEKVGLKR